MPPIPWLLEPRIDVKSIPASATTIVDVPYGTQTWMDRNLGARRVATAVDDVFSYGNHYQWGRPADGHEISVWNGTTRTAGRGLNNTTATLATTDAPAHGDFITNNTSPFDWRSDNNINRWATVSQGPCPAGYHVPTNAEWDIADAAALVAEMELMVLVQRVGTTLQKPLTLILNFLRLVIVVVPMDCLATKVLSASTGVVAVSGTDARRLIFNSTAANTTDSIVHSASVRCLKD